ncbi:hypothetical protein [Nonomuraea sp. NPDC049141]|uniref:hypothetical protein n=1 Tax=unclassified Nonomuraea TaxID=2593643 RepID=UPI0033D1C55C
MLRTEPLREPREPIQPAHHGLEFDAVAFWHGVHTVFDEVSLTVPEGQRLCPADGRRTSARAARCCQGASASVSRSRGRC